MVRFFVEGLFALVFAQALASYLRRRDPVQGDITLIFAAVAMLFVLDVVRTVFGESPQLLRVVALIMLFAQPYLTLRLVARIRPVPRLLQLAAIGGVLLSVGLVLAAPKLSLPALVVVLTIFVGVQAIAGFLLAREARSRSGSPRARLRTAAVSTLLFGLGLAVASLVGTIDATLRDAGRTVGYASLVISALGYVVAFMPPAWIRQMWSGVVSYRVSRQLLENPAGDTPDDTWTRYAATVRAVSGADAVLVIPPDGNSDRLVATAGLGERAVVAGEGDVGRLLRLPETSDLTSRLIDLPEFVTGYAGEVGGRYLTSAAMRSPLGTGALVLINRRRSLFAEDDVRLLAELGGQAAIIAERGGVRAEQERLAQELARSVQALSEASQAKSDFLASMSHELRTPLNAIIGFSELMRGEQVVEESRVVPVEWIEHIYNSGRHLLTLINDILDLAKIEAGRLELRPETVELAPLVADTVKTLSPLLERKRLRLHTEVAPVEVHVDRIRLRQVLDNLLSNAIKFTPEGGLITVRVVRQTGEVRLSVTDTGVGIEPADQQRIFEEFQQVGDVSMHQAGTGLGLALTKRLVESHGGHVELESTVGVGSSFTVCLPDTLGTPEPVPPAAAQAWQGGPAPSSQSPSAPSPPPSVPPRPVPSSPAEPVAVEVRLAARAGSRDVDAAMAGANGHDGRTTGEPGSLAGVLPPAGGAGILLIEDEPSAARLLRTYLESAGYRVRLASSGEEGLRLARQQIPDAVVLDVLLPGIDGWEVLRLLKQDPVLRDVPVFVASVVDERDVGMSLGATDFFVKPIDRQRLLARVAEYLLKPAGGPGQMHVLAVDDDPATLKAIADALRKQHVDVMTATSGTEAVELARTHTFDLIISDLLMPDIDGISLMNALDHHPSTRQIPVLMVTGPDISDADRSRVGAKALGILPKGDAVHEALHHWMAQLPRPSSQTAPPTGPEAMP